MNWLIFSLVAILVVGLILFFYGLKKKSLLLMFCGGMAFLAPIFYFIGWNPFLPFVPPIALVISYLVKKRLNTV